MQSGPQEEDEEDDEEEEVEEAPPKSRKAKLTAFEAAVPLVDQLVGLSASLDLLPGSDARFHHVTRMFSSATWINVPRHNVMK